MTATTIDTVGPVARRPDRLLIAGALAGPVVFASAAVQMATREGFDITRHPISRLATGGAGWIQVATFVLHGVAALVLVLPMSPDHMSVQIAVTGLVAFTWTTALALSLRRTCRT
ncbi:DUF998 domain-containing protein [Streptomyces sp. NPDC005794]|uniref:DUF998 domain-containing protein n=1 Tax=Streptomyces sp. NPDC005794 TaxID=3364733 RepID=UPI0036B29FB5